MSENDYAGQEGQGFEAYRLQLCKDIINLGRQLLEMGCNPEFTCPDWGESRPYHKKRLSRTDRRRLEKEGKL